MRKLTWNKHLCLIQLYPSYRERNLIKLSMNTKRSIWFYEAVSYAGSNEAKMPGSEKQSEI